MQPPLYSITKPSDIHVLLHSPHQILVQFKSLPFILLLNYTFCTISFSPFIPLFIPNHSETLKRGIAKHEDSGCDCRYAILIVDSF